MVEIDRKKLIDEIFENQQLKIVYEKEYHQLSNTRQCFDSLSNNRYGLEMVVKEWLCPCCLEPMKNREEVVANYLKRKPEMKEASIDYLQQKAYMEELIIPKSKEIEVKLRSILIPLTKVNDKIRKNQILLRDDILGKEDN